MRFSDDECRFAITSSMKGRQGATLPMANNYQPQTALLPQRLTVAPKAGCSKCKDIPTAGILLIGFRMCHRLFAPVQSPLPPAPTDRAPQARNALRQWILNSRQDSRNVERRYLHAAVSCR